MSNVKRRLEAGLPAVPDVDSKRCAYRVNGERCNYPGTISSIVHTGTEPNHPGPWYCRWHFECESPAFGEQIVVESRNYRPLDARGYRHPDVERVAASVMHDAQESAAAWCERRGLTTVDRQRAYVKLITADLAAKMASGNRVGTDWAQKILDRHAAGEAVASIALEMARRAIPREPGED